MENHPTHLALDTAIAANARKICQRGYLLFDQGDLKSALRQFYCAWTLLPKPQTQWEGAAQSCYLTNKINIAVFYRTNPCSHYYLLTLVG